MDALEQKHVQTQLAASVEQIKEAEKVLKLYEGKVTPEAANHRATALLLSAIARLLALQAAKEAHMLSQTVF
jgi:hypothetical protein